MTSDIEQFRSEWHAFKDDFERTLAKYRDTPPPSVSKLMLGIQAQIKDLNTKFCEFIERFDGLSEQVSTHEAYVQQAKGAGQLAKVLWSVAGALFLASVIGVFNMWVKVSHIDQDIRLTIQEELRNANK